MFVLLSVYVCVVECSVCLFVLLSVVCVCLCC